jgi:hypothetical protein
MIRGKTMQAEEKRRYVGIDVGKRTYAMAVISAHLKDVPTGKVFHSNGRTNSEGRAALYRKLLKSDKVAVEAGNLAFIKRGTFAPASLG